MPMSHEEIIEEQRKVLATFMRATAKWRKAVNLLWIALAISMVNNLVLAYLAFR